MEENEDLVKRNKSSLSQNRGARLYREKRNRDRKRKAHTTNAGYDNGKPQISRLGDGITPARGVITNGAIGIGASVSARGGAIDGMPKPPNPKPKNPAVKAKKLPTVKYLYSFVRSGIREFYAAGWQEEPVLITSIPASCFVRQANLNNLNKGIWTFDLAYTIRGDVFIAGNPPDTITFLRITATKIQEWQLERDFIRIFTPDRTIAGQISFAYPPSHGFWLVSESFETTVTSNATSASGNYSYIYGSAVNLTTEPIADRWVWIKNAIADTPTEQGRWDASINGIFQSLNQAGNLMLLPSGYFEQFTQQQTLPPLNRFGRSEIQGLQILRLNENGEEGLGLLSRDEDRFPDEPPWAAWVYNDGTANRFRRFAVGTATLAGGLSSYLPRSTYLYASSFIRKFAYCDRVKDIELIQNQPITAIAEQFRTAAFAWFDRAPVPDGTPANEGFIDVDVTSNKDPKFKTIVKVVDLQKTIGGQLSVVQAEQITEVTVDVYKIPQAIVRQVLQGDLTDFIIYNAAYAPKD